jgi:hypothetical protein
MSVLSVSSHPKISTVQQDAPAVIDRLHTAQQILGFAPE